MARHQGPAGGRNLPLPSRTSTTPITVPKSNRLHTLRGITSFRAGKMAPIAAATLLREDACISGRIRLSFTMTETAETLMNAVNLSVKAYLVPWLAFDRFEGSMDQLNRSWEGQAFGTLPVIPYITTMASPVDGSWPIFNTLGIHSKNGDMVNDAYIRAYNQIWNLRAKNRSRHLTLRTETDTTLAPGFWINERFKNIVPDFDQAVIDGEVALNVTNAKMPISGIGIRGTGTAAGAATVNVRDGTGATVKYDNAQMFGNSTGTSQGPILRLSSSNMATAWPDVFAELQADGITVSLSNIELARKTQAFARLREQYAGLSDDWIVNMLMDGLTMPEASLSQPMLIGQRDTVFGMSKRWATDGASLTKSATNGATFVDLSIQTPRIPCGGVIMIVAECSPDQLYERQMDPGIYTTTVDEYPHYLRDTLDPEKVEVVPCKYVDVLHAKGMNAFGYAPLNYKWHIEAPHVGGKYFRPVDDSFKEDRQRIWSAESLNPTLAADFYLCTNINEKPFMSSNEDTFETVIQGDLLINGNTVFGGVLIEAQDTYTDVLAEAPTDRIVKGPIEQSATTKTAEEANTPRERPDEKVEA